MKSRDQRIVELVKAALAEDAARSDITTNSLVDGSRVADAVIRARAPGVISGQDVAREVFSALDAAIAYSPEIPDGGRAGKDDTVARIFGRARAILSAERTALNFLGRLSGIATLTARFVEAVKGTGIAILDTRKTTPLLRFLEKEAVLHGGGQNHRFDLSNMILVKDNHISAVGGLMGVLEKLGKEKISSAEIEITSLEELRLLRETTPYRIMLDNFEPSKVEKAIEEINRWPSKPQVEVSGGITLENVSAYALPGVDFISVGSITSRAQALDLCLDLKGVDHR